MAANFLFISLELPQTESQYSSNGRIKEMYKRSKEFLLTLNLRARIRFSLIHAFSQMLVYMISPKTGTGESYSYVFVGLSFIDLCVINEHSNALAYETRRLIG